MLNHIQMVVPVFIGEQRLQYRKNNFLLAYTFLPFLFSTLRQPSELEVVGAIIASCFFVVFISCSLSDSGPSDPWVRFIPVTSSGISYCCFIFSDPKCVFGAIFFVCVFISHLCVRFWLVPYRLCLHVLFFPPVNVLPSIGIFLLFLIPFGVLPSHWIVILEMPCFPNEFPMAVKTLWCQECRGRLCSLTQTGIVQFFIVFASNLGN